MADSSLGASRLAPAQWVAVVNLCFVASSEREVVMVVDSTVLDGHVERPLRGEVELGGHGERQRSTAMGKTSLEVQVHSNARRL